VRVLILLLYLFAVPAHLCAQQSRQFSFQHFTTAQGLASNFINGITQDPDGFVWIATQNGVHRYDGNRFRRVQLRPESPRDGALNQIRELWSDNKGRLWLMAANNRIARLDHRSHRYREVGIEGGSNQAFYVEKYLFEGDGGTIFLHEGLNRLFRLDSVRMRFVPDSSGMGRAGGRNGTARVCWDPWAGRYWLVGDTGLVAYDPALRRFASGAAPGDNLLLQSAAADRRIYAVYATPDYLCYWYWLSNSGNPVLCRINRVSGKREAYVLTTELGIGYHDIRGFLRQRSGRLWVYGNAFLTEWNSSEQHFSMVPNETRNEQSLRFDRMFTVYEDRERNLWLGTDNGLFLFNPEEQLFDTYSLFRPGGKPIEAPVMALCQLEDSSFFVGTWSKGLFYYNKDFRPLPLPASLARIPVASCWDMAINRKDRQVWMGLQPGAFIVYNQYNREARMYRPELLQQRTVRQITSDFDGNMWIGLHDGRLLKWDYERAGGDPSKGYIEVLKPGMVTKVHLDRFGYMWVAGWANGLYRIDTRTNKVVAQWHANGPEGYRLFNNDVTDMGQYDDTTLIVTAGCVNILNMRSGRVGYFSAADGLPSDNAVSVQRDNDRVLWIGLSNGLCRLNLAKRTAAFYDRRDGILYDNFNMAGVEKLSSGKLVFYTDHNFLVFDPRRLAQTTPPPPPTITEISLQGMPLPPDSLAREKTLVLRYDRNSLAFEFSGLNFARQQKVRYFYRLEGLEKDWMPLEGDNRIVYNYLPPDYYQLLLRSENADGLSSTVTRSILIRVRPPVWQTWWFYALIVLVALGGLYVIDRERIGRIRSLQQVRTQIAGSLHQEVETTLSDIHVLSEIAKIRVSSDLEQSKDFIDQISNKSRHMMEAMDDVLWSIDPANDSMHQTLMRIREFTDGIKRNHTMDIDLIVDRTVEKLELDMALRHELYFYYKEALQFLLQHVICDQVFVNLKWRQSILILEIITACEEEVPELRSRFRATVGRRVQAMKGLLEITTDHNNLSIVLRVVL